MPPRPSSTITRVLRLGPRGTDDRRAAIQASIAVAGSLLVTLVIGEPAWASYAAFGAFTALYGRNRPAASRARRQLVAAVVLVAATTTGAVVGTVEDRDWLIVVGCSVTALLGGALVSLEEWRPPGPTFAVFAFGAVAATQHQPHQVANAFLVTAASAMFTIVVGLGQAAVRRTPGIEVAKVGEVRRAPLQPLVTAVITALAGCVAVVLGLPRPYWTMVAAVAILVGRSPRHRMQRGLERVAGTLIGLAAAAPLLLLVRDDVGRVLLIAVLQLGIELVVARRYTVALVLITPQALLMTQLGSVEEVGPLLLDRGLETIVGAVVALAGVAAFVLCRRAGRRAWADGGLTRPPRPRRPPPVP
jgi:hypothetical protein